MTNYGESLMRTASRLSPVTRRPRRTAALKKYPAFSTTVHARMPEPSGPVTAGALDAAHAVSVEEESSSYTVIMPLSGIDPRMVHVLATPKSLLIEVTGKEVFQHHLVKNLVHEAVHHNVSREFRFPNDIERGCTVIQIRGADLEIVAQKAKSEHDVSWSELIHFDTRSSRGCA